MFLALAGIAATITPSPSPSPSFTPDPTPVATVAAHAAAAVTAHPGFLDALNQLASHVSQADLVMVAGVVAVALQAWLNKLSWLQHEIAEIQATRRYLVSVALPFAGTALASFASGQNDLHLAPAVYLVGQFVFYVVKRIRVATPDTVPAPADNLPRTANP
jgi:hypothetical protein